MTRVDGMPATVLADGRTATKALLRLESDMEDALIDAQVGAAIGAFEAVCGMLAIARPVAETVQASARGWSRLSQVPVRSVEAVEAADTGATQAEDLPTDIDPDGVGWVRRGTGDRLYVRYTAGLADGWADLPDAARHGIVRLAAHLFTHRDRPDDALPAAVAALWRPFKRMRLR